MTRIYQLRRLDLAAPLYLQGARLTGITPGKPLPMGYGLMFSAQDQLFLRFTSDREMLPDPEQLKSELLEVLDQPGLM